MHPFAALLGIVSGSLVSLAFGLAVVLLVFWLLRNDHPQFSGELPEVARGALIFSALAVTSALAFFGTIRGKRWRYVPLFFLWGGLALAALYYWPS
ncbi:MAG: hypothetical protein IT486_07635 [Gammaproteobacteria bacterium]|nr:hypothetical protein [Gammaproteobacteria bacterium]